MEYVLNKVSLNFKSTKFYSRQVCARRTKNLQTKIYIKKKHGTKVSYIYGSL